MASNGTRIALSRVSWPTLGNSILERNQMNTLLLKLYVKFQDLMNREDGQDLVEYALVIALVALAATAGMKTLATDISNAFTTIGTSLNSSITTII